MLSATLLVLASSAMALPPLRLEAGTRFDYEGAIALRGDDAVKARKTFDLTLWISSTGPNMAEMFWLIKERGHGAWPWSERFGRLALDGRWRSSGRGPSILYEREDGRSVVPIVLPILMAKKKLAAGAAWKDDNLALTVEKSEKHGDHDGWLVNVRDPFGMKRSLVVDQKSPIVLAMTERVVMDKGKEYELKLAMIDRQQAVGDETSRMQTAFMALVALRNKLNHALGSQEVEWKAAELVVLREQLPKLEELASGTPLEGLVATAKRDVELQMSRGDALAELSKSYLGKSAPSFSAERLDGGPSFTDADLKGHVTVLHFWDYRDEPLKEPYGQVGYVDFMRSKQKDQKVQILGVAVDGRLADEVSRVSGLRSIKKLRDFMNLSYPILLDSGPILKQFGDPRVVGGTLPLFVVIDQQGKIVHYHVGHCQVHQDQGLKELDEVVTKTLSAK